MEIKYTRTYAPKGKKYTLGDMPIALGHAMEIIEPRPRLTGGKLNPGEMCMFLFALTPEEYALKDGDPKALDALAEQLAKAVPADRLLAWLVRDLKGTPVKSDIKPKLGESIDGGALQARVRERQKQALAGPVDDQLLECRRLQQLAKPKDAPEGVKADWKAAKAALGRSLSELETIFVAYDPLLGERWPAVGFDGRVEVFTTRLRAENVANQVAKANAGVKIWTLKELSGQDVGIFFKKLENDGLFDLRVDNGFASAELQMSDVMPVHGGDNSGLRSLMLREIAYGMRWNAFKQTDAPEKNKIGALESMLSLRNFVWHTLGRVVLFAACDVSESGGRLCTPGAYAKLSPKDGLHVVGAERCLSLKNKQTNQNLLAVFTSQMQAVSLCERIGSNAKPVAISFEEIILRAKPCDGVVIDPEAFSYRVLKQDFDKLRDTWGKPLTMVRVQPAETPKPEIKAETPSADAALGSLPDPDAVDAPAVAAAEASAPQIEAEMPEADRPVEEQKPKKGFFKRLFGQ